MRNMRDTITKNEGCIPAGYQLQMSEIRELITRARLGNEEDAISVIEDCFLYGFICGNRATVNGKVKSI